MLDSCKVIVTIWTSCVPTAHTSSCVRAEMPVREPIWRHSKIFTLSTWLTILPWEDTTAAAGDTPCRLPVDGCFHRGARPAPAHVGLHREWIDPADGDLRVGRCAQGQAGASGLERLRL